MSNYGGGMGGYDANHGPMGSGSNSSGYQSHATSSSRPAYHQSYGGDSLRRAASTYASRRPVSPPRSQAERPRQLTSAYDRIYDDHRSVSPLGTSRFEQPYFRQPYSNLQRANTTLQVRREQPSSGYYGTTACETTAGYGNSGSRREERGYGSSAGLGLSRSNAVYGRQNQRSFGTTGFSGGAADSRYEPARGPRFASDFSRGGFSNWENY